VAIRVPPLRARQGDGLLLAQCFLQDSAQRHGRATRGFSPDAIRAIQAHRWPGNVRELENRIKGAVIMADAAVVTASDLGLSDPGENPEYLNLRAARQRAEVQAVRQALAVARANLSCTAFGGHASDAVRPAAEISHRRRAVLTQRRDGALGVTPAGANAA
ncbi:MAG TPA: hypothetical protein VII70_09535, partial [Steroidobacteraceae bacterium]